MSDLLKVGPALLSILCQEWGDRGAVLLSWRLEIASISSQSGRGRPMQPSVSADTDSMPVGLHHIVVETHPERERRSPCSASSEPSITSKCACRTPASRPTDGERRVRLAGQAATAFRDGALGTVATASGGFKSVRLGMLAGVATCRAGGGQHRSRGLDVEVLPPALSGLGMIWSYGPEASAIAVGSTGGAPDIPGHSRGPVSRVDELERDLLLANIFCDDLYIHGLEGCVEHGFFECSSSIDWEDQVSPPDTARTASGIRGLLTTALWTSAHPALTLGGVIASACMWSRARRR